MFNDLLSKVEGADIFMIISLLIFVSFFIGVVIYVAKVGKSHISKMKNMPLDEEATMERSTL